MRNLFVRITVLSALIAGALSFSAQQSHAIEIPRTMHAKLHVQADSVLSAMTVPLPFAATDLGVAWSGHGAPEIRTSQEGHSWSDWMVVVESPDMSDHESERFAALVPGGRARFLQVRAPSSVDPGSIEVSPINTEDGPTRTVRVRGGAEAATPQPHVISRAEWGADESIRGGSPSFARVRKLFVHHTVTSNDETDPRARMRAIYSMHVQSNGWDDIGYNFVIDSDGNIYEGRFAREYSPGEIPTGENRSGFGVVGAHVAGYNTGSVGVALLGTFTTTGPTAAAHDALTRILAWKADRHGIHPHNSDLYTNGGISRHFPNISGHRDVASTACPGSVLHSQLGAVRDRVEARIQALSGASAPDMPAGVQLFPAGASRDLTPNAVGASSRSATRVEILFDGSGPISDRTVSVPASGWGFSLQDHHFGGLPLREDTYVVTAVAIDSVGRRSTPSPVSGRYIVTQGDLPAGGYWVEGSDGGIFTYGAAQFYGSTGGMALNSPVIGMAPTPSGRGYWLVAGDGGIFSFGDARFFGSTGAMRLNQPVVGMAAHPSGEGYWLVAADGGIFTFGNIPFYGSTGGMSLNKPVVGMGVHPSGGGYWLVASDGGIFTFGNIPFHGSTGAIALAQPIIGMAAPKKGEGYWLLGADGGIFTFGNLGYYGSLPGRRVRTSAAWISATFTGGGYFILSRSGEVYVFGDAPLYGSPPSQGYQINAVGMALSP